MQSNKEKELEQIRRKLLITNIIDLPAAILLGLGLHAEFGSSGGAVVDILNDQNMAYAAILVGGAIMAWAFFRILTLLKRRAELMREAR